MAKQNNSNFLDPKTIIAIILVGASWIGWQSYMKSKYPEAFKKREQVTAEKTAESAAVAGAQKKSDQQPNTASGSVEELGTQKVGNVKTDEFVVAESKPESLVSFEDDVWKLSLSSKGMGLKGVELKTYTDSKGKPIELAKVPKGFLPFETNIIGRRVPLDFKVKKTGPNEFVGHAQINGLEIVKKVSINSEKYSLDSSVTVTGLSDAFSGLTTYVSEVIVESESGGMSAMFMPYAGRQEFYTDHSGESDRLLITAGEDVRESYGKVRLGSIGSQYFVTALLDKSKVMPDVTSVVDTATKTALSIFSYKQINRGTDFSVEYIAFAGPKSMKLLESIDKKMTGIIDLGWFNIIGEQILKLLKLFNRLVGNWGVSIILLTLLVRTILLPLHIMSFRSMKGMQVIQPLMKEVRAKHKDDPAKANQEVMAIMREHKVNPMGGCIPTLLQFPVFIALYQVLAQSIELYHAPFMLWITDLSAKDPYFVLPVLMGLTMFLQMKTSPSTMDPNQQKIMMIMPLVFTFFMVSLPSGLTLYMFVSALFSVIQQLYFMKERKAVVATA